MNEETDEEKERPRANGNHFDRFCCKCGNNIVPGEKAWVWKGGNYHPNCMIETLHRAWWSSSKTMSEFCRRWILAECERDEWKGNHAHVVKLKRELEGKGPRPAKEAGDAK